ncbi:MAG: DUF86 domain-containing protein [Armatimonadota bacterium]|nr:DUF86 domain-containing protein [Armatimonadota bacterium]MDR7534416.1 DUF86 domain-containing protein [Armatimonadota bacterium]
MTSKLQLLPLDIAERVATLPQRLARTDGLAALWLYGSFARGEPTPVSDVDLAFLPEVHLAGDELDRFEAALYGLIAAVLATDEFAFTNLRRAPAYFASRVLQEGRLVVVRDALAVARFVEEVYRRAPDARWFRRHGNVVFLEGLGMPEPTVDRDRVIDFLRLITDDLEALRARARLGREEYLHSREAQAVVERLLQRATEGCLNIGNHIIARLRLRPPQDYADVFRILGDEGILSSALADRMMDLARFRNLLVHVYWQIDHGRVYDNLPVRLATLDEFVQQIGRWLQGR